MEDKNLIQVCNLPDHENGLKQFFCLESKCQAISRIGCAMCFIEMHEDHIKNKIKISELNNTIEEFQKNFQGNEDFE